MRAMEEFAEKMADKVGISKDTAMKVIDFLKDHSEEAVELISKSGLKDKLPGGLGGLFG